MYKELIKLLRKTKNSDECCGCGLATKAGSATEVVRCRDCKYYYYDDDNEPDCELPAGLVRPIDDSFCSYGERRESDG